LAIVVAAGFKQVSRLEECVVRQSLVVILVVVGIGAAAHVSSQTAGARNDDHAIKAVIAATTEAFSRHDAELGEVLHAGCATRDGAR
jgi:hypothetical protein